MQLNLDAEPPDYDHRTAFWMQAFSILSRTRPPAMGGIPAINPVTALDMADRLQWACEPEECLSIIMALDDAYRDLNQKEQA